MRKIIVDGESVNLDNGLFFGQGVFETILVNKSLVFLDYHLKRLEEGLKVLNLEPFYEKEEALRIIKKLNLKNKVLKITVTDKNVVITTRDIPYKDSDYEKGFKLKTSSVLRNSTSILTKIKSTNYIENIIEKKKAILEGYNDAVFYNEKGYLCETSTSNIFCIKDDKIFTPKLENGLLNGTVRNFIIENYDVEETFITKDNLRKMDEVFVTNSLFGIMKIKCIDEIRFNKTIFTDKIRENYNKTINGPNGGLKIYGK
ncbi:aminotransferase class IV [Clostridium baratii]|uniref:aminotransferase class IV n=1 Tax=Clostridium baratii TaxID=1561 RepID=UPI0030CEBCE1